MPQQRTASCFKRDPEWVVGVECHLSYAGLVAQAGVVGAVVQQQGLPSPHVGAYIDFKKVQGMEVELRHSDTLGLLLRLQSCSNSSSSSWQALMKVAVLRKVQYRAEEGGSWDHHS